VGLSFALAALLAGFATEREYDLSTQEVVRLLSASGSSYQLADEGDQPTGRAFTVRWPDHTMASISVTPTGPRGTRVRILCLSASDHCPVDLLIRLDSQDLPAPLVAEPRQKRTYHGPSGSMRWRVDAFGGVTAGQEATLWYQAGPGGWDQVEVGAGTVYGLQVGVASTRYPSWGAALDVSHITQSSSDTKLTFLPVSLLAVFRPTLWHAERPFRLSLPLALGLAVVPGWVTWQHYLDSHQVFGLGFDCRGGLAVALSAQLELFGQLRWLYGKPGGTENYTAGGTSLDAAQALLGLSWTIE
jgi:hypothetical protein